MRTITTLTLLALFASPALAIDPRVPALSRQVADDAALSQEFARQSLHPLRLRHLQIRSALNDFTHWANELAKDAARPGVDPGTIHHGLRNLEMWGGTIDYHLEPNDSPAIDRVRARWAQTKVVWDLLKTAAGFRPGNGGDRDAREERFDALYGESSP